MVRSEGTQPASIMWIVVLTCACIVVLGLLLYQHQKKRSLRGEISEMQLRTGSRLFQVSDNKIYEVNATSRSLRQERQFVSKGTANFGTLSPDGEELAFSYCSEPGFTHPSPNVTECPAGNLHLGLIQLNGASLLREYFNWTSPYGMCWSHDKSKLALAVRGASGDGSPAHRLVILDLNSGAMKEIAGQDNSTSTECWSPDDKKVVFTEHKVGVNNVVLFDLEQGQAKYLVKGGAGASWSPDGRMIAFSASPDSYSVIHPDGTGEKVFFKTAVGDSELWWSPTLSMSPTLVRKAFSSDGPMNN